MIYDLARQVVRGACAYEVLALSSAGRVPTITRWCHTYRTRRSVRATIVACLGVLTYHLLIEQAVERSAS